MMNTISKKAGIAIVAALLSTATLSACEQESELERAAGDLNDSLNDAGDTLEEAGNDAQRAIEDLGD